MRKKIIAANWKMNTTLLEGSELVTYLKRVHDCHHQHHNLTVLICPPFTHLFSLSKELKDCCLKLGAQNIYHEEKGAYTGEISAEMISSAGCEYVIIGHSERRQYFQEDNHTLAKKIKLALGHDLTPIYCCGETLEEREKNIHFAVIKQQIKEGLFVFDKQDMGDIVIAYEPVWAIGTGKTASPEQAEEIHKFIRQLIQDKYGSTIASNMSIIYGGSIKAANASDIFGQSNIDGGLVGGASLDAKEFNSIINSMG